LRHEVARGECASRGGPAVAGDVATGCARLVPAVTCVAGSRPVGCEAHGRAQGPLSQSWWPQVRGKTGWATTRKPLLMPRYLHIPDWVVVPGCQGPAAERRQATAADSSTAGEHRCPRGIEGARPGLGLMRAERVNLVRVRRAGAGMRRQGGRPTVRGAEVPGGTGCPKSEGRRLKGSRKARAVRPGTPPGWSAHNWPDSELMLVPARALTWAGEPVRRSGSKCRNRRTS
jgi:hypothetical protein